jgi:hypothetical protein
MLQERKIPIPVTLNDCILLHQMGYATQVNDGKVVVVVKEDKKRTA